MCRLFGLTAGARRVRATFWLVEAPDSLARQSRREPDGTGLGTFRPDGTPLVEKEPVAAYADPRFAREARERESPTFLAHVRYASSGALEARNTHPFEQRGRLFAHNGVIGDLPALEAELGQHRSLVSGDTDSERFFALVTRHIDANGGDIGAGIAAAVRWIVDALPVYSLNLVLTTSDELWALRYPETHSLFVLRRAAGGPHGDRYLEHASSAGRIRTRSGQLARLPSVVVASERMDEDPGWRPLRPGELVHVDRELTVRAYPVVDGPPRRTLELDSRAAASQAS
ncbi:class II glutamine amidotransferase [Saccharopolyspora rosea]|uniref:class II glutamine amidotransferase n=1 Tax=Saccharopolyspora rosea TaxID=524884 RepID=UPI0021D8C56E|nr:class II glutamine amidotransferase [Saccharopolyspora rosea]